MSNTEVAPQEILCETDGTCAGVELLVPRQVPLGGPRAMDVRRTLPQRQRSLIGAWCFLDHYGPDQVGDSGGMKVPRHPHTGLQTVSWLFTGEIEHRDSAGFHAAVRPGEVNLMTAGRGISHSEFSTPDTTVLHGAQLWVALPDTARHMAPTFEHYRPGAGQRKRLDHARLPGRALRVRLARHNPHTPAGCRDPARSGDGTDARNRCVLRTRPAGGLGQPWPWTGSRSRRTTSRTCPSATGP